MAADLIDSDAQVAVELLDGLPANPILKYFTYGHLPPHLQAHSRPFAELAVRIVAKVPASAERTVALRKLLESKDAAVRAALG